MLFETKWFLKSGKSGSSYCFTIKRLLYESRGTSLIRSRSLRSFRGSSSRYTERPEFSVREHRSASSSFSPCFFHLSPTSIRVHHLVPMLSDSRVHFCAVLEREEFQTGLCIENRVPHEYADRYKIEESVVQSNTVTYRLDQAGREMLTTSSQWNKLQIDVYKKDRLKSSNAKIFIRESADGMKKQLIDQDEGQNEKTFSLRRLCNHPEWFDWRYSSGESFVLSIEDDRITCVKLIF